MRLDQFELENFGDNMTILEKTINKITALTLIWGALFAVATVGVTLAGY